MTVYKTLLLTFMFLFNRYIILARNITGVIHRSPGFCMRVPLYTVVPTTHGLINYTDIRHQSKMSSYKKLTCKGTLRQMFITVYVDTASHVRIFDPALLTLPLVQLLPPPPLPPPCVKVQYIQTVCG
jgi:hypothetical protein